jgi:perosamine synthetase
MSYVAPAGTVVTLREIASGFAHGAFGSNPHSRLSDELRALSGAPHCWPVSSGRAAMTLCLEAMSAAAADPTRDEVIVPAYTCYSVPASIARAGLRPRLCDVDPQTLGLDPAALDAVDFSRVLAVVSANLYGMPNALPEIESITRRRGVYLLDDGAQSIGARAGGRAIGTFGDAGLWSFDKGKIISTIQGGAIVARDGPVAGALERRLAQLPPSTWSESLGNAAKLAVYSLGLRPAAYGMIRRLPLGLGRTEYETRYLISRLGSPQAGAATLQLRRVAALNAARRAVAADLAASLAGLPDVELVPSLAGTEPVYARFPVRITRPDRRAELLRELDAAGIGATGSYPQALCDVAEVRALLRDASQPMPGARRVAAEILTLPTHGYVPRNFGARVRRVFVAGPE